MDDVLKRGPCLQEDEELLLRNRSANLSASNRRRNEAAVADEIRAH